MVVLNSEVHLADILHLLDRNEMFLGIAWARKLEKY